MVGVYVFLGSGVGGVARWALATWLPQPWATLVVNLAGSLLLGFLAHPSTLPAGPWKLALCTGAMGGFTTYSTFNLEVLRLFQTGRPGAAIAQIVLTVLGALALGAVGWGLAGWGRA